MIFQFSNLLNYTVMALGNHDFDDGTSGLQPFVDQVKLKLIDQWTNSILNLKMVALLISSPFLPGNFKVIEHFQVNFPILAANVQSSQLDGVEASTVVNVKGRKVRGGLKRTSSAPLRERFIEKKKKKKLTNVSFR